jgi:hypothetical protein
MDRLPELCAVVFFAVGWVNGLLFRRANAYPADAYRIEDRSYGGSPSWAKEAQPTAGTAPFTAKGMFPVAKPAPSSRRWLGSLARFLRGEGRAPRNPKGEKK